MQVEHQGLALSLIRGHLLVIFNVQIFYLFTRPWRFAQELKTGVYARIFQKTIDADAVTQFGPAKMRHQGIDDGL